MDQKICEQNTWEKEYPQMPESFHLMLKDVVENSCEEEAEQKRRTIPKRRDWKRIYIAGIAAILTLAAAGVTATQSLKEKKEAFRFEQYLGYESREGIEDLFQTEIEVSIAEEASIPSMVWEWEDEKERELYIYNWEQNQKEREGNAPLLEIREVMYDGMVLAIHAVTTAAGEEYELGTDTINVGNASILVNTEWGEKTNDGRDFVLQTHLRGIEKTDPLEITIPLQVYKNGQRYENQDITFQIDRNEEMAELPDQKFDLDSCTVQITELVRSATAVMMKAEVLMNEEQLEAYEKSDSVLFMAVLEDADGTRWQECGNIEGGGYHIVPDPQKMEWYFYAKMPKPNMETVYLKLISSKKTSGYEKVDIQDPKNIWEEGIEISLMEKE